MMPMTLQEFFKLAMKRDLPQLATENKFTGRDGFQLNLGCGNSPIEGCINLDYPQWDAENYCIEIPADKRALWLGMGEVIQGSQILVPAPKECVDVIHAYHFLEHLKDPRRMLREMQRVLRPGGVINICVPHYSSMLAHYDLDHKTTWSLETWRNTFKSTGYQKDREGWKLKVHFNALMAVDERHFAILTQLIKEA